jgi:predicted  nucleic acid-binding Zn-ribbon protein
MVSEVLSDDLKVEGDKLDEYAELLSRIQILESELAESRDAARRFEWARDQMSDRCQELYKRIRQLESDGNEMFPCDLET